MQVPVAPAGYGYENEPLTYQVYAPDELPNLRSSMMHSRASFGPDGAPPPNVKLRIGLALLGVLVMVGTTALAIAGAAEDPPRESSTPKSASSALLPTPIAPASAAALPADPAPIVAAVTAEPPPVAAVAAVPAKPTKGSKAKAAGGASRAAAIPPNPFGAPSAPSKWPKKK
jgi:hypothetical protein